MDRRGVHVGKIKVLQVVGKLRIGGAETVAMNLYRYIDRTKFEFHYLVYGDAVGEYEEEVYKLGGKVIHMDYSSKCIKKYKKELLFILRENGPYDIIHTHMMFHNGIVLQVATKAKIPLKISHSHSTNDGAVKSNGVKAFIRNLYLKYTKKLICEYSDLYIACGTDAGNYLYGDKVFNKYGMLFRNGIDINKYVFKKVVRDEMRDKYNLQNNKVYSCIGHFEPVKNHKFLINMFQKLYTADSSSVLILLGDGRLRSEIEILCQEKNIKDKVLFMGNVNNVDEWLQAIDFLLMPSLYEGIPVTLVEAQAAGLKCFVSENVTKEVNITGAVEYLPLDEEKWVDTLTKVQHYNRDEEVSICLKNKGYDIVANVKNLEEIYLKQLDRGVYEN